MKRKKILLSLLLCGVLLLSACGNRMTVEELLSAPALTADQSSVAAAIEGYFTEPVALKYPTAGDRRAPIQFIDMNNDGKNEAVVFFLIPSDANPNARIAILTSDGAGNWAVIDVLEGPDADVRSVRVLPFETRSRFLLVEWSGKKGLEIAAYTFDGQQLIAGFADSISAVLVYDLDGDGDEEFCYVAVGANGQYVIKFVDTGSGEFPIMGVTALSADMTGCVGLTGGRLDDNTAGVFVDENISDEYMVTEVLTLLDGRMTAVQPGEDYTIAEISRRPLGSLTSRRIAGSTAIYIPSASAPTESVLQKSGLTYWYAVGLNSIRYVNTTYVDTDLNMALCLPDSWLPRVVVSRSEEQARLITVYDTQMEYYVLYLKVLTVGESAASYIESGYSLLTKAGSFRYYIKGNCSEEDFAFICENSIIL